MIKARQYTINYCFNKPLSKVSTMKTQIENTYFALNVNQHFCSAKTFKVNGKVAYTEDFGTTEDTSPDEAPDYGCGNMQFIPYPVRNEILEKYEITEDEYNGIVESLVNGLSFGECDLCA